VARSRSYDTGSACQRNGEPARERISLAETRAAITKHTRNIPRADFFPHLAFVAASAFVAVPDQAFAHDDRDDKAGRR